MSPYDRCCKHRFLWQFTLGLTKFRLPEFLSPLGRRFVNRLLAFFLYLLKPIPLSLWFCGTFWASVALAQPICDKRDRIISYMEKKYGELVIGRGLANNGGVAEFLSTRDGKTWTLMYTYPTGMTCLLVAGKGWETVNARFGEGA